MASESAKAGMVSEAAMTKPKPRKPAVPLYPEGYFLEPIKAWPGLNQYEPRLHKLMRSRPMPINEPRGSGEPVGGWAGGTIFMPKTPGWVAPAWLPRAKAK